MEDAEERFKSRRAGLGNTGIPLKEELATVIAWMLRAAVQASWLALDLANLLSAANEPNEALSAVPESWATQIDVREGWFLVASACRILQNHTTFFLRHCDRVRFAHRIYLAAFR